MKSIIAIAILLAPFALQADDEQDAKDFAQALIQSRDYKCDKVKAFSTANFSGKAVVWCDDRYEYEITQPGGRWKVEAMN